LQRQQLAAAGASREIEQNQGIEARATGALEDSGAFTGLASTFDNTDLTGDRIFRGAFSQSIARQPPKGYPVLWSHRQDEPIGVGRIEDSKDGLVIRGQLLLEDPAAARAYLHLRNQTVRGLSIGFSLPRGDGKVDYTHDGAHVLKEIFLHEVSLVSIPANPLATVTSVKTLGDVRHILKSLSDEQVDEDVLADLIEVDRELKRLLVGRDPAEAKAQMLAELAAFSEELKRRPA